MSRSPVRAARVRDGSSGDLDAQAGALTMAALGSQDQQGNLFFEASLPGTTHDITIADDTLTLTAGAARLNTTFTKIGD